MAACKMVDSQQRGYVRACGVRARRIRRAGRRSRCRSFVGPDLAVCYHSFCTAISCTQNVLSGNVSEVWFSYLWYGQTNHPSAVRRNVEHYVLRIESSPPLLRSPLCSPQVLRSAVNMSEPLIPKASTGVYLNHSLSVLSRNADVELNFVNAFTTRVNG